ncbi:MAG: hypothetical protein J0L92_02040 [Deltaproteobacteria bacterium]|nr:hypothetical protein [Deltaproteobacteria bacterium]
MSGRGPSAYETEHWELSDITTDAAVLSPESLVDRARTTPGAFARRHWCTKVAESADARTELNLMAAFDEDTMVTNRRHGERVELAVEGALATLDDMH